MSKIYIDWDTFHYDCAVLAEKIKSHKKQFKSITAITRGGLFTAGMLAYLLDIKDIKVLRIESYDSEQKKDQIKLFSTPIDFTDCLLVDDLTDTGDTLESVLGWQAIKIQSAVLYRKKNSSFEPTFYTREFNDDWIVFPWDNEIELKEGV